MNETNDILLAEETGKGILQLTLNRPEKRKRPLGRPDGNGSKGSWPKRARAGEIRAIIFRGKGKAFCAGLDLGEAMADKEQPLGRGRRGNPARRGQRPGGNHRGRPTARRWRAAAA